MVEVVVGQITQGRPSLKVVGHIRIQVEEAGQLEVVGDLVEVCSQLGLGRVEVVL